MAKFKFYVSTGFVGSSKSTVVKIDDSELEGMSEYEKQEYINEQFEEWVWNTIDSSWTEEEE